MKGNLRTFISERVLVGNKGIWTVLLLLLGISLVEVYSASSNMTYKSGNFWLPVMGHTVMIGVGLVVCSIIAHLNMTFIKMATVVGNLFSIFLLLCALVFGEEVNGASRWVFGLQPSEIAKGILVMTVALILSLNIDPATRRVTKKGFKWALGITALNCLLIVPENLSTAMLTFFVIIMVMFVGRVSLRKIGTVLLPIILVGGSAFLFMKTASDETVQSVSEWSVFGHQPLHRLPTWAKRMQGDHKEYSAKEYPINDNQQVAHAHIAVATSGIWGRGPGNSIERDFLPQAYSDFIFAIIIEELGLVGGIFVLLLYLALLFQVGNISRQCKDRFPQLLAMGLTLLIVTQALFNMGVAVGMLPVTGQQLPLISRGGTGIILNCCYMGMILAMSRIVQKQNEEQNLDVATIDGNDQNNCTNTDETVNTNEADSLNDINEENNIDESNS